MKVNSIVTFILIIAIKISLEYSYITFVFPLFNYEGFYLDISIIKAIESYVFLTLILVIILTYLDWRNIPSRIGVYIILIMLYIPLSSLFWLQNQPRTFFYTITISLIIIILIISFSPRTNNIALKEGPQLILFTLGTISIVVYGMLLFNGGIERINFNILDGYAYREAFNESSNWMLDYLLTWQAYVVNLVILAFALYNNKRLLSIFIVIMQIFLFSMANFKSFLFAPFLLIGFHFLNKTKFKNNLLLTFSIGTFLLIIMSNVITKVTENILIESIFVRRLFFVPSKLHYVYYSFFEDLEKYKLSHSIFGFIIDNKYSISPVALLARDYYGREFSPNVGFFGDAYVNFGLMGIIFFSIIYAFLLKLIDSLTFSIPSNLTIAILVIPLMALVNSAFLTSLLTHGILFAILILWLVNQLFRKSAS